MKRVKLLVGVLLVAFAFNATAQDTAPDPDSIGIDSAQQSLQEISIDRFEDPGFWIPSVAANVGIIMHRRVAGSPMDKEPIPAEVEAGIEPVDEYVIGVRTDFFRRGPATISLRPVRPLSVPGIVKTLSVWVVGRNFNHELSVVLEDYFGNVNVLRFGRLNFSGWKQLTVAIPPTVVQRNPHYNTETGLRIRGFIIETDITETYGTYYVYFDDLRAVTDLFGEETRDPDDMVDNW